MLTIVGLIFSKTSIGVCYIKRFFMHLDLSTTIYIYIKRELVLNDSLRQLYNSY
jgi:hypothetical protein